MPPDEDEEEYVELRTAIMRAEAAVLVAIDFNFSAPHPFEMATALVEHLFSKQMPGAATLSRFFWKLSPFCFLRFAVFVYFRIFVQLQMTSWKSWHL